MNRRHLLNAFSVGGLAATGLLTPVAAAYGFTSNRGSAFLDASRPYQGVHFNGTVETNNIAVRGKIPVGLRGTLYRNGPARFSLGGNHYNHWFDGDGMVQAFNFEDGKASHKGVLLQTPKKLKEDNAGRFLYPAFGTDMADSLPIENPDQLNVANINVLPMQGGRELYALWEAGSALQLDTTTLQSKGFKVWSPETAGAPFSAHPRISPDGTLWNFGYAAHSGSLIIYEITAQGKLKRQTLIEAPQADMVHDFAITENYLVFLLMPLTVKKDARPVGNLDRFEWHNDRPMIAMLVNKSDFSTQCIDLPNGGVFHLGNAWEEGGLIRLGFARYLKFLDHLKGLNFPTPTSHADELASWEELEINPRAKTAKLINTGLYGVEFPRFDVRRTGEKTDFTVLMQNTQQNTHAKTDPRWGMDTVLVRSGERTHRYAYGRQWLAEEHILVPAKGDARTTSGWILGTAFNSSTHKTTLSIFAAHSVAKGPVAQLELPYGLPLGLHGQFVPS
jgi:all-trans-8'-apo-beta-carotenal 15,15'-oxygenase